MFNTWFTIHKGNKHNCLKPYVLIRKTAISAAGNQKNLGGTCGHQSVCFGYRLWVCYACAMSGRTCRKFFPGGGRANECAMSVRWVCYEWEDMPSGRPPWAEQKHGHHCHVEQRKRLYCCSVKLKRYWSASYHSSWMSDSISSSKFRCLPIYIHIRTHLMHFSIA